MLHKFISLFFLLLILQACTVESQLDGDLNKPPVTDDFDEDGAALQLLDATSNEEWVYFDLDENSVVTIKSTENPAENVFWDIAFKRFQIKINGGVSGDAGVEVAVLSNVAFLDIDSAPVDNYFVDEALNNLTDDELLSLNSGGFFPVCEAGFDDEKKDNYCLKDEVVDREHLNLLADAYVFLTKGSGKSLDKNDNPIVDEDDPESDASILGWYNYYPEDGHKLKPAKDIWIIKSTDGNHLKLELKGYYGFEKNAEDDDEKKAAESANIAFRFISLTPGFDVPAPGPQQLRVKVSSSADESFGNVSMNEEIKFVANISGAEGEVTYLWNFGDGHSSGLKNVDYAYTSTGAKQANLIVMDSRGIDAAYTFDFKMYVIDPDALGENPVANAGLDQIVEIAPGDTDISVELDGSASIDTDSTNAENDNNIISYRWKIIMPQGIDDSGSTTSDKKLLVNLAFGSYIYQLTTMDISGNTSTDTVSITVNSATQTLPIASMSLGLDKLNLATGQTTITPVANVDNIISWEWSYGDTETASGATPPVHLYELDKNDPGTVKTVVLTVMDNEGGIAYALKQLPVVFQVPIFEDTYMYELLGNQHDGAGDSGKISVWNHESNHGAKGLIKTSDSFSWSDSSITEKMPDNRKIILNLYQVCETGSFIGACAGDPGAGIVLTDVIPQTSSWTESSALVWSDIAEITTPESVVITQTSNKAMWLRIDVTQMVELWVAGSDDFGFSLSQENYSVIRAMNGSVAVSSFCDSESTDGICATADFKPYIEVVKVNE